MSFDIIVIRPLDAAVADISEVAEVLPLGSVDAVSEAFNDVFAGSRDGIFVESDGYAFEISLSGEPVTSVHIALRFGNSDAVEIRNQFLGRLTTVCNALGAIAFAVSDNSRLAPELP